MTNRVLVTGIGALTSFGLGAQPLWTALQQAQSAIAPIRRFDTEGYRTKIGAEIDDEADFFSASDISFHNLSRNSRFAVATAYETLSDSQLLDSDCDLSQIGICLGSGLGGIYYSEESIASLSRVGPRGVSPMTVPFVDPNSIVSQIAMRWGLAGQQFTVSTACSSSAHAIGIALDMLRAGRCSAMLVGGVEATMSPLIFAGFDRLRAMSSKNDTPTTACRPFSEDRDGFVMAEGAAMMLMETEAHAQARQAKIYAEVLGYGATGGAHHIVMPRPDGEDLVKAMQRAMVDAEVVPQQIDLINPHGTGTKLNDAAEFKALTTVFKAHLDHLAITPTKQLTGHMLGASGALEALHLIQSISESRITPVRYWDESMELNVITNAPVNKPVNIAVNNSFGFGNNNVSLVFGAYK